jgi:hypothetical protein
LITIRVTVPPVSGVGPETAALAEGVGEGADVEAGAEEAVSLGSASDATAGDDDPVGARLGVWLVGTGGFAQPEMTTSSSASASRRLTEGV